MRHAVAKPMVPAASMIPRTIPQRDWTSAARASNDRASSCRSRCVFPVAPASRPQPLCPRRRPKHQKCSVAGNHRRTVQLVLHAHSSSRPRVKIFSPIVEALVFHRLLRRHRPVPAALLGLVERAVTALEERLEAFAGQEFGVARFVIWAVAILLRMRSPTVRGRHRSWHRQNAHELLPAKA